MFSIAFGAITVFFKTMKDPIQYLNIVLVYLIQFKVISIEFFFIIFRILPLFKLLDFVHCGGKNGTFKHILLIRIVLKISEK